MKRLDLNQEEYLQIMRRLTAWREERQLTIKSQKEGLISNILEELTEFSRAKDAHDYIDALCDISVFLLNTIDYDIDATKVLQSYQVIPERLFSYDKEDQQAMCRIIATTILTYLDDRKELILYFIVWLVGKLGYSYYLCMDETLKEIESRVGHYDETIKKFVKDKSPEAQAKWYKADYSKCKVN